MNCKNLKISSGENIFQKAYIEVDESNIDYEINGELSYVDILAISKGLRVVSEFFDVNAVVSVSGVDVNSVALGKSIEEALVKVIESNPLEYMSAIIVSSSEVDSDVVKRLKNTNKIVAPNFTKNAMEYMETQGICYVKINTPLKDYKKYLSEDIKITPLGVLHQAPNMKELDKETFKVVSQQKPSVEQIEDAVFAWKIAKHVRTHAIVIAKDLHTSAISQGMQETSVEYALDFSCDMSKDSVLASDKNISIHDLNVAAQGRIALLIVPFADSNLVKTADKYGIIVIETGFTNILY